MTREVLTVSHTMLLSYLAKFFDQHQVSGAPVVGEDGKFIGLVTEDQLMVIDRSYTKFHMPTGISLLMEACNGNIQNLDAEAKKTVLKTVQAIYMRVAATIEEDTPVEEIAALMTEKGAIFICLPPRKTRFWKTTLIGSILSFPENSEYL